MNQRLLIIVFLLFSLSRAGAQITINYPVAAQQLTRGLDSSLLTINLGFSSACTGVNLAIGMPSGVEYIPGSVIATGGTGGLTITYAGGTPRRPQFTVSNGVLGNNITFAIKRLANCGAGASGKDSVYVTAACGNSTEVGAAVNTYNILAPSLSVIPPAAIANANIGGSYSRTFSVTNGGNGCLDTLRLAVKRLSGSVSAAVIKIGAIVIAPYAANADTLFYKVSGANLPGGDNLLCNGESVTFTEEFVLLDCAGLTTTYIADWGRTGNSCQSVNATGIINMATGVPNLTAVYSAPAMTNCGVVPRTYTLTITNTGTTPAGNLNITVGDGENEFISSYAHYIDTTSIMVTAPSLTTYHPAGLNVGGRVLIAYSNNTVPFCAGGKVGMLDFNMPAGYMLAVGQSMTVTFDMQTCAGGGCNDNSGSGTITAAVAYKDQCGSNNYLFPMGAAIIIPGPTLQLNSFNAQFPAQVAVGACFDYKMDVQLFKSKVPPATPFGYIEYAVTLPAGFTLNTAVETGSGLTPHAGYPKMVGNVAIFRHDLVHQINGQSTHTVNFNICVAPGVCGIMPLSAEVRASRDSTCAAPIISKKCVTGNIEVFCFVPCLTGGVEPTKWSYGRTTFGLPDNNNDGIADAAGSIDFTKIDRDRYRPGDILHSEYRSYILNQTAPSVINNWNYVYSEWNFNTGKWSPSGTATVTIKRGATTYTLTGVAVSTVTAGTEFKADWSTNPALPGGFTYQLNDSVIVEADFIVDANSPAIATYFTPGFTSDAPGIVQLSQSVYTSQAANPPAGPYDGPNKFTCFVPKYNANIVGLQHFISFDGINPNGATGCANFDVIANAYTRILSAYANGRYFTYEYRPEVLPDTVWLDIPAGWDYISQNLATITYTNAPSASTLFNLSITPAVSSYLGGTRLTYDYKTLLQNGTIPHWGTDGMQMSLGIRLRANCATPATANVVMTERGHMYDYPNAAAPLSFLTSNTRALNYNLSSRPAISLQNNTGAVQGVLPQHYWDVQVNSAGSTTAPNVWFALEQGGTGISIDSVVLKPSNAVLAPTTYAATKKWYQVSTGGVASGSNQQARIYFKYSSCTADSIKLLTGWSCSGYPSPDPSGNSCNEISTYLKILPQPSRVQLSLSRQPAVPSITLCTTDTVEAIVNSALGANVDNPSVTIIPPVGFTVNLPIQVEYPLGSGTWQNVTAAVAGSNYVINLEQHAGIGTNGLAGTIINPAAPGRQAKIRVSYSVGCDFVSGSRIGFITTGQSPCGSAAAGSGDYVSSGQINITGASTTGTAGMLIDINPPELACSAVKTVPFNVTPITSASVAGDTAVYTLPAGILYAGNFTPGANCAGCTVTTSPIIGGGTLIKVKLPAGVAAGTAINYTMDLQSSGIGDCGNTDIRGEVQRLIGGLSCGPVACPNSKIIIGTATQTVTVKKPLFTGALVSFTQSGFTPTSNTVNYTFKITNSGTLDAPAGYLIKFYCGTSAAGTLLYTVPTSSAIPTGTQGTFTGSFTRSYISCPGGNPVFARIEDTLANGTPACMCGLVAGATSTMVLPVKLESFTAIAKECKTELTWKTNSEINFSGFEVEYAADGTSFTAAGIVKATNSITGSTYRFTYLQPDNKGYYRLKMADIDGRYEYSKVIPVTISCNERIIAVSPNPTQGLVLVTGLKRGDYLQLYSMDGKLLLKKQLTGAQLQLDLTKYAADVFTVSVLQKDGTLITAKVVKIK